MRRVLIMVLLAVLAGHFLAVPLAAQEDAHSLSGSASPDWDIDSLFDEPPPSSTPDDETPEPSLAASLLTKRGFAFEAAFQFVGGFIPGWNHAPWYFSDEEEEFSTNPSAKMKVALALDANISEAFRVKTAFFFEIPGSGDDSYFRFYLDEIFFDYTLYETVFFRVGKFNFTWGISPNYSFTNLLSRIPDAGGRYEYDPFFIRINIPLGVGGIQLLSMTRVDILGAEKPNWKDLAYGGKYNLALPIFDLDVGVLYQKRMDMRGFLSLKTTLWETELYNEYLGVIDSEKWNSISGAVNLGFMREFFSRKLSVNAEVFYNAEKNAIWYSSESDIKESSVNSFLEGFNFALNLLYRFGGKGSPRFFLQTLYNVNDNSARLTPGFRLSPWEYVDLYFAVPMTLGSKNGYYYKTNEGPDNQPFSIALLINIKGTLRSEHYF